VLVGVTDCVGGGVEPGVLETVGVTVIVGVSVGVTEGVGVTVEPGVDETVGVIVGVFETVGVGVGVAGGRQGPHPP
jgi:hypothetical protein